MPETRLLRQKMPKKWRKRHFPPQKPLKTVPKRTHFKNMLNTLIRKRITKNHPICHPPRLENYFFSNFCLQPPKKRPWKHPKPAPNRAFSAAKVPQKRPRRSLPKPRFHASPPTYHKPNPLLTDELYKCTRRVSTHTSRVMPRHKDGLNEDAQLAFLSSWNKVTESWFSYHTIFCQMPR